ncbi:MAG: putative sensor domain DACNV-containing protein [Polyangiaceae bacterium]
MANDHAYPAQLAEFARVRWPVDAPGLPSRELLEELVSTAYQASLMRDEERPVSFRVILCDSADLPADRGPPNGLHRLIFDKPRTYGKHELRRLSPAATYHRSLIGVRIAKDENGERLEIWGVVHSGPRWLQNAQGGRKMPNTLPRAFVMRAAAPGRLAVACGLDTIAELRGGRLTDHALDVFESQWLPERFAAVRAELDAIHAKARADSGQKWADLDPRFTGRLAQQMLKRIIATIRTAHHGGTLLFVPSETPQAEVDRNLLLKYGFFDDSARSRYRQIILKAMQKVASVNSGCVTWEMFEETKSVELSALDEAITELAHLVASLAAADGAVVLSKRFELVGFGAEIIGDLPETTTVARARDLEGATQTHESVEGVGTRHRSAYRFCQRFHDAIALVISQDGTVRFVAHKDGTLTYWDHVSPGSSDV